MKGKYVIVTDNNSYFKGFYKHQGEKYIAYGEYDYERVKHYKTKERALKTAKNLLLDFPHLIKSAEVEEI